jgi:signal transduction histidine kinase
MKKTTDSSLLQTERRLISIFVIGAFAFLLLFEAFFIGTRLILENQFQKEEFVSQIKWIIEWKNITEKNKRSWPPRIGINSVILDGSGKIIEIRGNIDTEEFAEFIDSTALTSLPQDTIITYDDTLLLKKKQKIGGEEYSVIFFKKSGYPLDDILRDILRFLVIDILLVVPFYFIGRYYVGRTLEPVAENIDTMSHFIHDAGHELKTPLAIVSGNLQILRDSKVSDKDLIEESITTIHSMADSLDGLVELANLKAPTSTTTLQLKENIEETLALHHEQIEKKNITVTLDIPEPAQVSIEKKHFQILFSNLITNAIRYNKDDWNITIKMKWKKLTITDTGIGMTEAETKRIFERFYRADRTGKTPGTGIGLTIVERIVRLYGWTIEVKSEKWVGTSFVIDMK